LSQVQVVCGREAGVLIALHSPTHFPRELWLSVLSHDIIYNSTEETARLATGAQRARRFWGVSQ